MGGNCPFLCNSEKERSTQNDGKPHHHLHLRGRIHIRSGGGAATLKRLIGGGNGDAALLYLAILHSHAAAEAEKLAAMLKWDLFRSRAYWHTPEQVRTENAKEKPKKTEASGGNAWMKEYLNQ